MRGTLKTFAMLLAVLGVGAFLFAWSGLYNVGASQGHWAITYWFLEFAMRNSIETHAAFVDTPPDLDDIALVQRGAGHYENGCAPCHGAPAEPRNPISRHMLPAPPDLTEHASHWEPKELYWITLNGIKMAGMPAWPAQERKDEPWALVAFLRRLDGMDAQEYRRLAFGEVPADGQSAMNELEWLDQAILETCARCHGYDGAGRGTGAFPRLAGQSAAYLYESLRAYASGARPSGIMQPPAAALSETEMRALAEYYATRDAPPPPRPEDPDPRLRQLGSAIASVGDPDRRVAPCASCHGPGPRDPRYPLLAGQYAGYLAGQLHLWQRGLRTGTSLGRIMAAAAHNLTDEQIRAVSLYYALLPPSEDRREAVAR
ncbi:MAG TPA: c-type cytochrome [Azospirillum sp.]|nr:c-type cytochrome [Azospirillum sp.]